jgi:hypothetical protein
VGGEKFCATPKDQGYVNTQKESLIKDSAKSGSREEPMKEMNHE